MHDKNMEWKNEEKKRSSMRLASVKTCLSEDGGRGVSNVERTETYKQEGKVDPLFLCE